MDKGIADRVEALVAAGSPEIEVLLVEVLGGGSLRVFIDRDDGVGLEDCEAVTGLLGELREQYAIEVSSPGPERPLTKPEHFTRFSGRQARLRLNAAIEGRESLTVNGQILDAGSDGVALLTEEGRCEVSWESIGRANLVAA